MSDDPVKQALAELGDLVRCRCHEAYKTRGLHDPGCNCDTADAVKVLADRIEALERGNAAQREAEQREADWAWLGCVKMARREALEEAARAAERFARIFSDPYSGHAIEHAARHIRALKEEK